MSALHKSTNKLNKKAQTIASYLLPISLFNKYAHIEKHR